MKTIEKPLIRPNPVGQLVQEQMRALLEQVDAATTTARSKMFLDADWNMGFAFNDRIEIVGPAATEDCLVVNVGFTMTGELDASKPLIRQLTNWLNKCLADLQRTTDAVATVEESRDIRALRSLIKETAVPA